MYATPVCHLWVPPPDGYNGWFTVGARLPCLGNMGVAGRGITVQDSHGGLTSEDSVYTTISNLGYHSWTVSTDGNRGRSTTQDCVIHG